MTNLLKLSLITLGSVVLVTNPITQSLVGIEHAVAETGIFIQDLEHGVGKFVKNVVYQSIEEKCKSLGLKGDNEKMKYWAYKAIKDPNDKWATSIENLIKLIVNAFDPADTVESVSCPSKCSKYDSIVKRFCDRIVNLVEQHKTNVKPLWDKAEDNTNKCIAGLINSLMVYETIHECFYNDKFKELINNKGISDAKEFDLLFSDITNKMRQRINSAELGFQDNESFKHLKQYLRHDWNVYLRQFFVIAQCVYRVTSNKNTKTSNGETSIKPSILTRVNSVNCAIYKRLVEVAGTEVPCDSDEMSIEETRVEENDLEDKQTEKVRDMIETMQCAWFKKIMQTSVSVDSFRKSIRVIEDPNKPVNCWDAVVVDENGMTDDTAIAFYIIENSTLPYSNFQLACQKYGFQENELPAVFVKLQNASGNFFAVTESASQYVSQIVDTGTRSKIKTFGDLFFGMAVYLNPNLAGEDFVERLLRYVNITNLESNIQPNIPLLQNRIHKLADFWLKFSTALSNLFTNSEIEKTMQVLSTKNCNFGGMLKFLAMYYIEKDGDLDVATVVNNMFAIFNNYQYNFAKFDKDHICNYVCLALSALLKGSNRINVYRSDNSDSNVDSNPNIGATLNNAAARMYRTFGYKPGWLFTRVNDVEVLSNMVFIVQQVFDLLPGYLYTWDPKQGEVCINNSLNNALLDVFVLTQSPDIVKEMARCFQPSTENQTLHHIIEDISKQTKHLKFTTTTDEIKRNIVLPHLIAYYTMKYVIKDYTRYLSNSKNYNKNDLSEKISECDSMCQRFLKPFCDVYNNPDRYLPKELFGTYSQRIQECINTLIKKR